MARRLALLLGIVLLGVACAVLLLDIVAVIRGAGLEPTSLGDLLFRVSRPALDRAQAAIQSHVSAALWESVIAPILRMPAALALGLPGLILLRLGIRRRSARHGGGSGGQ
jgi:hypothetical protein